MVEYIETDRNRWVNGLIGTCRNAVSSLLRGEIKNMVACWE